MPTTAPTINTYISDMLALERHTLAPLQAQSDDADVQQIPKASQLIMEMLRTTQAHVSALETRLAAVDGHAGSGVKSGVASALGAAAAAINKVRKTEVSKDLRDDHTALSLASISYTMLQTTALGLGDMQTAALAKSHLTDYATLIMKLGEAIPAIVLAELAAEGVVVDPSVASQAREAEESAWHEAGQRSGVSARR